MKIDGSSSELTETDILSVRFQLVQKVDYLIQESIYYRNFSEDMKASEKIKLYNCNDTLGKCKVT